MKICHLQIHIQTCYVIKLFLIGKWLLAQLQKSPSWPLSQSRLLHVPFSHMAWDASEDFPRCWLGFAPLYLVRLDPSVDPKS
jgi:hypothetical protein